MDFTNFLVILGESLGYPAFWLGLFLVGLFAQNRFAQSKVISGIDDPQAVPRSFTTRFRYFLSSFAYIGYFEFFYGLLVGIGSLPVLQKLLTQWVGGLDIPAELISGNPSSATEIGTPAWAVLFVTAVLPSAPGFDRFDRKVLKALHNFASIPHKARGLANELIENLTPDFIFPDKDFAINEANQADTDESWQTRLKVTQLGWLFDAIKTLQDSSRNGDNADNYENFFRGDYQNILEDANEQYSKLQEFLDSSKPTTEVVSHQITRLLNICVRMLSYALLQNESSERLVRNKIRNTLGMKHLPKLPFDFNATQIVLNFLLVVAITFVSSLVMLGFMLPNGWPDLFANDIEIIKLVGYWLIPIALTMAAPFVFAAGVRLYFMDRRQRTGQAAPLDATLVAAFCLFTASFSVGLLPTLLGMVSGGYELTPNWVLQVIPSGLTPALVALLFCFLSSRHLLISRWLETLLDVALFASLAGGSTYMAVTVAHHTGMDFGAMANIKILTQEIVLLVAVGTHAVMVGIVGAVQCSISRSTLPKPQRSSEAQSEASWEPEPLKVG
jgi:hypothetical protein